MKKPLDTLLVAVGGYGDTYAGYLLSGEFDATHRLVGVVDPYAAEAPHYAALKARVPIYDTMAQFYAQHSADMAVISSPIQFHYDQCLTAFRHGTHVLCEKPLVPTLAQLDQLEAAQGNLTFGVAFQWCHSRTMLSLKERILAGEFGRATRLKSFVSWPRDWSYYNRGIKWAGNILSPEGTLVYDSVASNATAHYIQNMLYLLGPSMEESAPLSNVSAECYRANRIQSFDTIAFKGTAAGAEVHYCATHPVNYTINPLIDFQFEKARIWLNVIDQKHEFTLHHQDGRIESLGFGLENGLKNRLHFMAQHINGQSNPNAPLCTTRTVRPFTSLVQALFQEATFHAFPPSMVVEDTENEMTYVPGLHLDLWDAFQQNKLPHQAGFAWAQPADTLSL